jgi:pyranose oxidase
MMKDMLHCAGKLGSLLPGSEPQFMPPGLSLHIYGVTRMGKDTSTSVVDLDSRVHGTKNLFVAGLGTIPMNMAANPTLTAAAIAIHSVKSAAMSKELPPKVSKVNKPAAEIGVAKPC